VVSADDSFDLAAAGLRADGSELSGSLEMLAGKLEGALPGRTRVQRRGGGLLGRGAKRVAELEVELGANRYQLQVRDGCLEGFRERQVGGIAIKREPLGPEEWLAALTSDLRVEAERSAQARDALERLLG
jgi:hypothetical protein